MLLTTGKGGAVGATTGGMVSDAPVPLPVAGCVLAVGMGGNAGVCAAGTGGGAGAGVTFGLVGGGGVVWKRAAIVFFSVRAKTERSR